jgi:PleD family two-component response regulator
MEGESCQIYDLSALLRINGLDIWKIAKNESLLVGEYSKSLSKLLEKAPLLKESLTKVSNKNAADADFKCLEEGKTLLEETGCDKLASSIGAIIITGKDNNNTDSGNAAKILEDLETVCKKITNAKRDRDQDPAASGIMNVEQTNYEIYETKSLFKTLKIIEHEELTRKIKILAVDDAPIILKTISSVLGEDYKVYGMSDPTMLEDFLKQITPELFLLDYKMPKLSGFDLVPIIRSFEEHKDTPIIFLTSEGKAVSVATALALGACDYIVKPFQGKQLREKIKKHLGRESD